MQTPSEALPAIRPPVHAGGFFHFSTGSPRFRRQNPNHWLAITRLGCGLSVGAWYDLIGSAGMCCRLPSDLPHMQFMWGFSFYHSQPVINSHERIRHPTHRGMLPVLHLDPIRRPAGAPTITPRLVFWHQNPNHWRSITRLGCGCSGNAFDKMPKQS